MSPTRPVKDQQIEDYILAVFQGSSVFSQRSPRTFYILYTSIGMPTLRISWIVLLVVGGPDGGREEL